MNGNPLLDCPPEVTTTFPVEAPTGTVAMIVVLVQFVVNAVTPLNVTDPELPKFVPEIVTDWPIPPGFGEMEEMVGTVARAKQQVKTRKAALRLDGTTLTLYADRITVEDMPFVGELIIDNWAAREAIKRQTQALDAIRFDRAVRGDLRRLLVHPETCRTPTMVPDVNFIDKHLDAPKQTTIASALGSKDILLVQGPPGTGTSLMGFACDCSPSGQSQDRAFLRRRESLEAGVSGFTSFAQNRSPFSVEPQKK